MKIKYITNSNDKSNELERAMHSFLDEYIIEPDVLIEVSSLMCSSIDIYPVSSSSALKHTSDTSICINNFIREII